MGAFFKDLCSTKVSRIGLEFHLSKLFLLMDRAGLIGKSKGDDVIEEYKAINTLSSGVRSALVNIGHLTERMGKPHFHIQDCLWWKGNMPPPCGGNIQHLTKEDCASNRILASTPNAFRLCTAVVCCAYRVAT